MVWTAWKHVRTGDPVWRQASFFWVKVYGLVFAMGIATGVVQEFAFGMNWSQYSRFVGNVFGSLLAAEGVFAFFLEGGFLGLMLFGGDRLGPRMWLLATFLVVFGAHFSALWILMANSWMQTPAGYQSIRVSDASGARSGVHDELRRRRVYHVVPAAVAPHVGGLVDDRLGPRAVGSAVVPPQAPTPRVRKEELLGPRYGASRCSPCCRSFVFGAQMAIAVTRNQAREARLDRGQLDVRKAARRCTSWGG